MKELDVVHKQMRKLHAMLGKKTNSAKLTRYFQNDSTLNYSLESVLTLRVCTLAGHGSQG